MSSEEVKTKTATTHRSYDEAFKRAALAQWQSGVPARRVAEGLGLTTESVSGVGGPGANPGGANPAPNMDDDELKR